MRMFPIIPIWLMLIICVSITVYLLKDKDIKKHTVDIIMIILLFCINLRIMYPNNDAITASNNLDVLFVIDNTISMNAEDYNGKNKRLDGVKKDCAYIISKLNGARFSVITFNNKAKIVIPYTRDPNIAKEAIDIIEPVAYLYAKGSTLNVSLDTMLSSLKSSAKKEDRRRIVFYISDGEINTDEKLSSFKEASKYIKNGAVLGYGTTQGGYMIETGYSDENNYIRDYENNTNAVSKIDEKNLKQIAKDMNIEYIHMEKQSDIDKKLKKISKMIENDFVSTNKKAYNDTYFILIFPLLALLLYKYKIIRGSL